MCVPQSIDCICVRVAWRAGTCCLSGRSTVFGLLMKRVNRLDVLYCDLLSCINIHTHYKLCICATAYFEVFINSIGWIRRVTRDKGHDTNRQHCMC